MTVLNVLQEDPSSDAAAGLVVVVVAAADASCCNLLLFWLPLRFTPRPAPLLFIFGMMGAVAGLLMGAVVGLSMGCFVGLLERRSVGRSVGIL